MKGKGRHDEDVLGDSDYRGGKIDERDVEKKTVETGEWGADRNGRSGSTTSGDVRKWGEDEDSLEQFLHISVHEYGELSSDNEGKGGRQMCWTCCGGNAVVQRIPQKHAPDTVRD